MNILDVENDRFYKINRCLYGPATAGPIGDHKLYIKICLQTRHYINDDVHFVKYPARRAVK